MGNILNGLKDYTVNKILQKVLPKKEPNKRFGYSVGGGVLQMCFSVLVEHFIREDRGATASVAQRMGGTWPYVLFKVLVFIICVSFVKRRSALRDPDNEPVSLRC